MITNYLPFRIFFFVCFFFYFPLQAQQTDTIAPSKTLDSIRISAYGGKSLLATPAAISFIGSTQLNRFANFNVLQAVNATPGVRMEERSPGSYRLNIRGSSVRSPYGVRNVKLYYDEIPFTAPGGSSMLNMLGFYNIGSLEIIKGPGSSRYGAGTGGVMLISSPANTNQTMAKAGFNAGSFGTLGFNANVNYKGHTLRYEHLQANGYREHTEMKRKVFSYSGELQSLDNNQLKLHLIYSDLFYQTPGALTLNEYQLNPVAARPAAGPNPGAVQANANIHQQAVLLGLSNQHYFSAKLKNITTVYGFYNETENPAIQNVELKKEPHIGGRTVFDYQLGGSLALHLGGELQNGDFTSKTYRNLGGQKGLMLTNDELELTQWMGFAQMNWKYQHWLFTAGASINNLALQFLRQSETPVLTANKSYQAKIQPRFAALYQVSTNFSAYFNVAKGFSPPASSEIFADNNSLNLALQPETGWNFEPGVRGKVLDKLYLDASFFITKLSNTIVTRRDAAGANYYINAGKNEQKGVEASLSYSVLKKEKPLALQLQLNYSYYWFKYKEFVSLGQNYSGNQMPGIAPENYTLLADLRSKLGLFANLTYSYASKIALNDANSEYADAYQIMALKLGYQPPFKKMALQFYVGADNLFNQNYSLGNDINGFGGRYYNVAPTRSFYFGATVGLVKQK